MRHFIVFLAVVGMPVAAGRAATIETVSIGNPGNAADTHGAGYGAVRYVYEIGKYEVTAGQYAEFLNAVAATDTYGLYNSTMDSQNGGCQITQIGTNGSYTYDFSGAHIGTAADWENRPVNFVSWGDAARFANWLHNGQPTGAQDLSTTEDGSYYLNGATTREALMAVTREGDATWCIPTEDEWYKAAYHKNDGVTANYFDYPTRSDDVPSNDLLTPDPGNNANYDFTIGYPYNRTEVGEFENSYSPYGTFDQGGNIEEWNETADGISERGVRGGSFGDRSSLMLAESRNYYTGSPDYEHAYRGFRVALVPEPGGVAMLVGLGLMGLLYWRRRYKA